MARWRGAISALVVTSVLAASCGGDDGDSVSPDESGTTSTTTSELPAEAWTETDLAYATRISDGMTVTLDIHFPAEPEGAPIVLDGEESLVEHGVIVVKRHEDDPLDLAVGPEDLVADRVSRRSWAELLGCTNRLARARASELGNDDPIVVLAGFSLLGGLAAQVALFGETLDTRWDEFARAGGPPRQFDCAVTDGSTHVDAVIGMAGTYDLAMPVIDGTYGRAYHLEHDPEMQEFLAGAIGANQDLEFRLIHGTNDEIPVEYATEFAGLLTYAGYDVELTTWPGAHEEPPSELYLSTIMEVLNP